MYPDHIILLHVNSPSLLYLRAETQTWEVQVQLVNVAVRREQWSNRPRRGGKYPGSPETSGGSVLCLIEPDPLILENKLKISFSLRALTRGGAIKGDNCCLALGSRPYILSSPFQQSCLGPSITAELVFPAAGTARGIDFHWNVWWRLRERELGVYTERSTILFTFKHS